MQQVESTVPRALSGTAPPSNKARMCLLTICLSFVKGEQDQGTVVVEVGIVEQWEEPVIDPRARKVNGGVVTIVDHIGRHEHPLGQSRGIDIGGKIVEVRMKHKPGGYRGDRIVEYSRIVLPYIVSIWRCRGVEVVNRREAVLFGMSKTSST